MQASACGALLPLVKYAATGSIDALLSVGILPLLVRLLLFQTDKHPSQITIYACLGIVKYSDTVCQQLAKASSPKKGSVTVTLCSLVLRPYSWVFVLGKQVASSAIGTKARKGGAKARPAEGVVYNLQLPSVASPPSKRVQAQMTPTYGTNESNVLSANAFAASKPPGESNPRTTMTTRVRPSPSDPNLPSLESLQSSDMKSTAKRPSRPTRQTGSSPPKRPANPPKAAFPASPTTSPKQKQAAAASDRPLVGSPKSTQAHSVIVKQGDPAIEVAIKRPPGRSSSVGVSPRQMSVPLIVVDQAWGGPIEEDEKQTARTSPTRPVPPPPKVITPLGSSEHVGSSVFRFRRTVDTSSQAAPNGGGGSEGATADVNPTFPVNGTPSIPPPDGVSCTADTPLHPRNIKPTVDSFEPTRPCITTAAVTGRTHATRDGIVDQATPRDAALSSATEKHPSKGPVEDMTSPGQEQQQDTNTLGVISDEPPRDHTDDTTAFLEPPLQSQTPHTSTRPTGDPEEADLLVDRKTDLATDGSGAAKGVDPCAFVELLAPLDASPPHDNGKALSPRRYGPMTPANTFVGAFFPPISTLDLDVVAADLMLVETVIETARRPTDRRFVPMTPANTFVGLQNTDAKNGKVPGTTCPVEFALRDDTDHDVLVPLLAAQLVGSWLYDATLSLSQSKHDQQSRSPLCDDDDNALEFCPTVATAQELPAWSATSTNHQEPPNADVQGMMAPSIEVSMLAGGQMVRGCSCDVQNRLVGDPIPLSVQWQDEEDNMDNANRRRVSESFEALPPPYVDEYDVAIARVASQLVQVWLYDTMDKLVSQATTAAPTLIVMAQLSPPDISPLCGLAMDDICDTVSSSYSCQIHELERLEQATLGTPEFQHEAAKEAPTTAAAASDVQPTDTLQERDEVCYEADFEGFVSTPEGVPVDMFPPVVTVPGKEIEGLDTPSTKTIEDESLVVQVSVVASQLVRAWIHTAVVSCINRIVTPPAYSGEDLLPAASLVPNLPPPLDPLEPPSTPSSPSSLVNDGFSMVSEDPKDQHLAVDVSLVAAQLVQSWIYETLDRVTTFSTRPHEHHHNHHQQQHASEDWGRDEEVETTKGATAQGDDCDEWSVASAMLAQRLVQAWMYETLARVTQFFSTPPTDPHHDHSLLHVDSTDEERDPPNLRTADTTLLDDVVHHRHSVQVSLVASQLVQIWVYDTVDRLAQTQQVGAVDEYADDDFDDDVGAVDADADFDDEDQDHNRLPAYQSIGGDVHGVEFGVCGDEGGDSPASVELEGTELKPHKGGSTDEEINDVVCLVTSKLARQLVQLWIYSTMLDDRLGSSWGIGPRGAVSKTGVIDSGTAASHDDMHDGDDEGGKPVSFEVSRVSHLLVHGWVYEILDKLSRAIPSRNPLVTLSHEKCNEEGLQDGTSVNSMSITDAAESGGAAAPLTTANDEYKEGEADSQLSVAASVLAAQLVQAWIVETLQRVVRFTTRPHEHPMVPIRDRATAECHVITSLLDPLTAIHSSSPSNPMAFDDGDVWNVQVSSVAPLVKAWLFQGMLNAVESLISSSSSVVFIDQGLLRHDVSDATILRPPILYFDQATARRPESSLSDPELDGQAPVGGSVEVSLLTAQLVRGWIYFTLDDVVRFSTFRQHHDAQAATSYDVSSSPPPDTPNELVSTMHAQPDDSVTATLDLEDGREDERGVAVSFVAGQLVRLWLYETMDAIVRFSCHHDQTAPVSTPPAIHFVEAGCFIDAVTPPVVSPESGAFVSTHRDHDEEHDVSLEVVLVANLLVRAWTSDAVLNIVGRWQADHDAVPSCISSSAKEQPQLDLTTAPCPQEAETRPICLKGWARDDNNESLEVVLLANLLVRAWTSEAILRVMYDSSFPIPVDVTTGSSTSLLSHDDHSYFPLDCPIIERNELQVPHSDGGTPPSHTSPFAVDAAASKAVVNSTGEGETIPPLEVVLWANLLVRAWTFEAMVLVLDAAPMSIPPGQGSYPPEEVTLVVPSVLIPFPAPSFTISPATTAPRENSTDDEVSFEVVLLASLLVRAWTCDAMGCVLDAIAEAPLDPRAADSTLNQIASSCTDHASSAVTTVEGATSDVSTVSPSPDPDCLLPTALPAAATAPIGSVLDDEMSLEVVLLANLLVRAWVSDAMGRVLDVADGDGLAEQITPTTALSTDESPTKQEVLRPRPLSSQSQHVNDSIDFPTALTPLQVGPLMESVVRQCPGGSDVEQSHQVMSLEIVLLANLLVRAWVSEAVMNVTLCDPQLYLLRRPPTSTDQGLLQKASAGSDQPDSTEPSRQDNRTKPLVRTTLQCGTASASDIQKSTEKTLTDQHDDMVYVLLANLLVRAWISEATGLVLDRVPTHIPSLFTTTKFNVPTDKNSVDLAIASTCCLASSSTSSTSSSLPDEADDDKHIAAIFTKWNEGECTHESCRRLEGEYLKGALSVGDCVAGYVAAPVTSAMTNVGTFQWPQIATSPHEMDVAIALLAAQMTRWWIFEALCSVSNKKLQKLLLRGDSTQHHHQRWSS
ncbi:hypothetical protein B5M09_005505 [Aphanomyces astaci]|uniref:Uncharacterized protein n=1 Tax=Aphanomyces astaci TaxID=112090 RepID=A0A425D9K6_APHAT|nr:hypothetical protein B5M09_005505 [Aphanomyces astaci]